MARYKGYRNHQTWLLIKLLPRHAPLADAISRAATPERLAETLADHFEIAREKGRGGKDGLIFDMILDHALKAVEWYEVAVALIEGRAERAG